MREGRKRFTKYTSSVGVGHEFTDEDSQNGVLSSYFNLI